MYLLSATDVIIDTEKLQDVAQDVTQKAKEAVPEDVTERIGLFQQYMNQLPEKAFGLGIRIVFAIITLFLGIQVIKLIRRILKRSLEKGKADAGVVQFLDSFVKAVLTILLVFTIAINFGVDAASIVAILGSMGVAISLALQGSLSNFAGGMLILLLKPFKIGDYIVASGVEGTVTSIDIFYTKIRTVDYRVIVIPNGTLSNNSITNVSAESKRRLDIIASASYNDNIDHVKEVLMRILDECPTVIPDEEKKVFISNYAGSSVDYNLRFWVRSEDYWDTKFSVTESIKKYFDKEGIEIPYSKLDVNILSTPEKAEKI